MPLHWPTRSDLGVSWELARYHNREHWLQVFPAVWGLCLAACKNQSTANTSPAHLLRLLFCNWMCMTLIHGAFCTWNDLVDHQIDAEVERTKRRPLPSGRITRAGALASFAVLVASTAGFTYLTLGPLVFKVSLPIYVIAFVYPYTKRFFPWPQMILAPAVGWPAFVGWVSVTKGLEDIEQCIPLFLCYCAWTVYFDTCYGMQDKKDDKKVGVRSLPLLLGKHVKSFLAVLGASIILLLAVEVQLVHSSLLYRMLVLGVWAVRMYLEIQKLDHNEGKSGGLVFQENIQFGLYVSLISVLELGWKIYA